MTAQTPRHSVSVAAAVVNDEDKVLAIKRRDNEKWEPPGGVLEVDEDVLDGLAREVHEETGLSVSPARLTGVYKNVERGILALVFRCIASSGQVTVTAESREFKWLTRQEVSEYMDEVYAIRMLDALEEEGAPAIRAHDGRNLLSKGHI